MSERDATTPPTPSSLTTASQELSTTSANGDKSSTPERQTTSPPKPSGMSWLKSPLKIASPSARSIQGTPKTTANKGKEPQVRVPLETGKETPSGCQSILSTPRRARPRPISISPPAALPTTSQSVEPGPSKQASQSQAAPFPLELSKEIIADTTPIEIHDSEVEDDDDAMPSPSQLSQMHSKMYPKYKTQPKTPTTARKKRIFKTPVKLEFDNEVISVHSTPACSPKPKIKPTPSGSKKRKHVDDKEEPPKKKLKRRAKHDDYWLLDGSIIIAIDDKMFRLSRSHLVKQSTYFRDHIYPDGKLADPDGMESVVPIYVIKENNVSAKNFACLLLAMDNAISYVFSEPSIDFVISVFEVAHSLGFEQYAQWAQHIIERRWSPELDAVTRDVIPGAMDAVVLAKRCDIPSIRKRAMYELYRELFVSKLQCDGSPEQRAIIDAVDGIRRQLKWDKQIIGVLRNRCEDEACKAKQNVLVDMDFLMELPQEYEQDQLWGFKQLAEMDWKSRGCCDMCATKRRDVYMHMRKRLWDDLDAWYVMSTDDT